MQRFRQSVGLGLAAVMLLLAAEPAQGAFPGADGKLAFVRQTSSASRIYVMNVDRTGVRNLSSSTRDFAPAWSPSGAKIAFASGRTGNSEIYTMSSTGLGVRRVTFNNAFDYLPVCWTGGGR